MDDGNSEAATVMKFDGTNWVNVGNAGFSTTVALYTNLAFNDTDQPYVAFQDWGNSYKTTVMKFDGTNRVNAGNKGFSSGEAGFLSLAFSQTGKPVSHIRMGRIS